MDPLLGSYIPVYLSWSAVWGVGSDSAQELQKAFEEEWHNSAEASKWTGSPVRLPLELWERCPEVAWGDFSPGVQTRTCWVKRSSGFPRVPVRKAFQSYVGPFGELPQGKPP